MQKYVKWIVFATVAGLMPVVAFGQMSFLAQTRLTTIPSGTVSAPDFQPFTDNRSWFGPNNWSALVGQFSTLEPSQIIFSMSTNTSGRGTANTLLDVVFSVPTGATYNFGGGRLYQNDGLGASIGRTSFLLTGPIGPGSSTVFASNPQPGPSGNIPFTLSGAFPGSGAYRLQVLAEAAEGGVGNISGTFAVVPTPTTAGLMLAGSLTMMSRRRR